MHMRSVRLEDVQKEYTLHNGALIKVLDAVNVCFEADTTYAIMGASGTGKSTLLHILAGIVSPTSGNVVYDNQHVSLWDALMWRNFYRQRIGLLFQQPYLIQELTVIENVMLKGMVADMPYAQAREHAQELLGLALLADKADCLPAQLSGGQQQRVALMRALFMQPDFLLADEPTGNLDPATGERMLDIILACQERWHMGVIVSTHDSYVAKRMQHILVLEQGKINANSS